MKIMRRFEISLVIFAILVLVLIDIGTSVFAISAPQEPALGEIVSNELEVEFNVTAVVPPNDNSQPTSEEITIIVDTGDGSEVSKANILRTRDTNGTISDQVIFTFNQARETVENANRSDRTIARIVIPDEKDEVSQLTMSIPKEAADELASGGVDLEIYTDNAKIIIPNSSLVGLTGDLFFRVVPIKDETERNEVEERARIERVVREVASDNDVDVVARPMTIETNLTSRAVDIILPLLNVTLPTDPQEREAFLADLVIFIEHSDGDRQLVKPEVVDYEDGQLGLKFGVNKFSTFTILNMEGWEEYIRAQEESNRHDAYMEGYPDNTFKPDKGITRAEMAMILYRVKAGALFEDSGGSILFADVATSHWAKSAIQYVNAKGIMVGYPNEAFKPEQSITRSEMAVIVNRWLKLQADPHTSFSDVLGNWAEKDISLLKQAGIIAGYPDGTFRPDKTLSRAEGVTIINSILGRGSDDWSIPTWSDVPVTHWAFKHIDEASNNHRFTKDIRNAESLLPSIR